MRMEGVIAKLPILSPNAKLWRGSGSLVCAWEVAYRARNRETTRLPGPSSGVTSGAELSREAKINVMGPPCTHPRPRYSSHARVREPSTRRGVHATWGVGATWRARNVRGAGLTRCAATRYVACVSMTRSSCRA